ncbi:MAG: PASTA domain-containing protein [Firmicutes bacterium]|nr:PASTA domain-containing protein [Bacillota bacterium]MCM1400810.1 PASTA domain-containing protein [Bacteroides sp.]MCM1477663.1 PASTA domain-containing protein [Bacteroides sp.]
MNTDKEQDNGGQGGLPIWLKVVLNVILMIIVGVVLVWLSSLWIDSWTRHGEEAVVPSVKGLSVYDAEERLSAAGFTVVINDSIYDAAIKPGQVVDQSPKENSTVKDGCTVYLSINAFSPRQVVLPALTDISYRQAKSILDGLGIKNVRTDTVPSDFKDLVLSVKRDGKRLMAGARVPINANLVVEIGAGIPEEILNNEVEADSMDIDTTYTVEKLNLF